MLTAVQYSLSQATTALASVNERKLPQAYNYNGNTKAGLSLKTGKTVRFEIFNKTPSDIGLSLRHCSYDVINDYGQWLNCPP